MYLYTATALQCFSTVSGCEVRGFSRFVLFVIACAIRQGFVCSSVNHVLLLHCCGIIYNVLESAYTGCSNEQSFVPRCIVFLSWVSGSTSLQIMRPGTIATVHLIKLCMCMRG